MDGVVELMECLLGIIGFVHDNEFVGLVGLFDDYDAVLLHLV